MARIRIAVAALILFAGPAAAQIVTRPVQTQSTVPSGACSGDGRMVSVIGTDVVCSCESSVWTCADRQARIYKVCKDGCEYTSICGMTVGGAGGSNCSTGTNVTCVVGSALRTIKDAGSMGPTNPWTVLVAPGVYQECIAIDNMTDGAIVGDPSGAVTVRPAATDFNDVAGSVIRIATSTTSESSTARISISGLAVQNDSFSFPEAAITVGKEAGGTAGEPSPWNDISIRNVRLVAAQTGLHVFGSQLVTDDSLPRLVFTDSQIIAGAQGIVSKGYSVSKIANIEMTIMSNWCESTDTAALAALGPTAVQTGAGSTTTVRFDAAHAEVTDFYAGRSVLFAGGAGCPANGARGFITDYQNSTNIATFTPAAAGTTDDSDCTYAVSAVPNVAQDDFPQPGCSDIDWSVTRAGAGGGGYGKVTCANLSYSEPGKPPAHQFDMRDSRCRLHINDFGPQQAVACDQQGVIGGVALTDGEHAANFDNVDVLLSINSPIPDPTCTDPFAGVFINTAAIGSINFRGRIEIANSGDADENVYGILASSTGASTITIPYAQVDVSNTAGGYTGTTATVKQASTSAVKLGQIFSSSAITTTGTIGYMTQSATALYRGTAPPVTCAAGVGGTTYYDTDVNEACICNGTSWLQIDDMSTGCS